jgi:predicted glutamine amidotransferase
MSRYLLKRSILATVLLISLLTPAIAQACRLQAMMGPREATPVVQRQEEHFFQSSLLESDNSLVRESARRPRKKGSQEPYDLEDLSGLIRRFGSPDGWGLVSYSCPMQPLRLPEISKSIDPAFSDRRFAPAVSKLTQSKPNLFLAHVRQTDNPKSVAIENVHPFNWQNWSLMHNGTVSGAFAPNIDAKINAYRDRLGGGPQGKTDSERVFYYFLALLLEQTGTTDSSQVSLERLESIFRTAMRDIIAASSAKSKPLDGEIMGVTGQLETQPSCNFILSDGQRIFAFRRVLNLYLGEKTLKGDEKLYIISSERSVKPDKSLQWLLLPENHILTIRWNAQGQSVPKLTPLGAS